MMENISPYMIRDVQKEDYKTIVEIYSSNPRFLVHHLGMECIDESFIKQEVANMKKYHFIPSVIIYTESKSTCGILDYKPGEEVYLSLLMLKADMQGRGLGSDIYSYFEAEMFQEGSKCIRIDVVKDYDDNVISFWEKQGFLECENIILEWGNKKSNAVTMRKELQ